MEGKRDRVNIKASSTVIGFESDIGAAAATDGGKGDWSNSGLPEIRRVVRPGNMRGRLFKMAQELILLRDRSMERRVGGNLKSMAVSVLAFIALMEFPRRERCSRFGSADTHFKADSVVISL